MLASMANGGDGDISMTNGHSRDFDGEPVAKKMRVGANGNGMNGHGDETDVEDEVEAEDEVDEDDDEEEDEVQEDEGENGVEVVEEDVDRLEDEQRRGLDEDDESGNDSD